MDEKSDIRRELNEVDVPNNKQDFYGSKNYLCNLELSTASLIPHFVWHLISSVVAIID